MNKDSIQQINQAENLQWCYFSIECPKERLYYLKQVLEPTQEELKKKCLFERTPTCAYGEFGKTITEYTDKSGQLGIANIKYNPQKKYQLMVQTIGIKFPLKKGTKTRKFLEELLDISQTNEIFCGDIPEYGKNIIIK